MNKMKKFTDKYFLRANEILKAENLNPWVNMQVFVRQGPGEVAGIEEAIQIITENSNIVQAGGHIYAKRDKQIYQPKETLMNIIAPVQEIIELETVYLGIIAANMTRQNDNKNINLKKIANQVEQVVQLANPRPVMYFGARHWHYNMDKEITKVAIEAGCADASTDNGTEQFNKIGLGTIPHALENIYAYYFGMNNAVAAATDAFDRIMPQEIPRIALVDYANREIRDTLTTAYLLAETPNRTRLNAVRVDTCGENIAEGGKPGNKKFWEGTGVTVEGVYKLRQALNNQPLENKVGIVLSSGFSNPEKVRTFNQGEKYFNQQLYDAIGAGFLDGVRCATADIIAVGENADEVDYNVQQMKHVIHKVGRPPRFNTLERFF